MGANRRQLRRRDQGRQCSARCRGEIAGRPGPATAHLALLGARSLADRDPVQTDRTAYDVEMPASGNPKRLGAAPRPERSPRPPTWSRSFLARALGMTMQNEAAPRIGAVIDRVE